MILEKVNYIDSDNIREVCQRVRIKGEIKFVLHYFSYAFCEYKNQYTLIDECGNVLVVYDCTYNKVLELETHQFKNIFENCSEIYYLGKVDINKLTDLSDKINFAEDMYSDDNCPVIMRMFDVGIYSIYYLDESKSNKPIFISSHGDCTRESNIPDVVDLMVALKDVFSVYKVFVDCLFYILHNLISNEDTGDEMLDELKEKNNMFYERYKCWQEQLNTKR